MTTPTRFRIRRSSGDRHAPAQAGLGRTILRWVKRIGIGGLVLVLLLVGVGAGYEAVSRSTVAKKYPPRGELIDIGGRRIHLDCRGSGSPTVVFESGVDPYGSLAWTKVHDPVAAATRACAYDRAGIMWSDTKDTDQNGEAVAADLHAALTAGGEKGPFILVAHSLGGPYAMIFTKNYGDQVAGLVFVDTSHPDQEQRLAEVLGRVRDSQTESLYKIAAALSWTGLVRIATAGDTDRAPTPGLPPDAARQANAYLPTSLSAMLDEADAVGTTLAQAGAFRRLGNRPLVVLTGSAPRPPDELDARHLTPAHDEKRLRIWTELQADEASWSTNSRHQLVPDASHYVQLDRPDVVISAVVDVIAAVRVPSTSLGTSSSTS